MTINKFELLASDAKKMFIPPQQKEGKDTAELENFIDELAALYEKYHPEKLTAYHASHVFLQFAISSMIKFGYVDEKFDFALYVRKAGDVAVKGLEQHTNAADYSTSDF